MPILTANLGELSLTALLGYAVVFLGLILLMIVVEIVGKIFTAAEKKQQAAAPAPVVVTPAPVVVAQPAPVVVATPAPVVQTTNVWVPGAYQDQVQANGTVVRVWVPGHYEQRTVQVQ